MSHIPSKACPTQAEEIAELNQLFHLPIKNFIWDTSEWVHGEIEKGNYYVIKDEETVTAALCLHVDENKQGTIEAIAVRKDLHGQGIGKNLVEFSRNFFIEKDAETLKVESFCEYGLTGFYKSCGFLCKEKKIYEGHEYFCFEMPLKEGGQNSLRPHSK